MKKENILLCIKDSLTNMKLVLGLEELRLTAEDYYIQLPVTLLSILSIKITDEIFEKYMDLFKKVEDIDIIIEVDRLNELVDEIYQHLVMLSQMD